MLGAEFVPESPCGVRTTAGMAENGLEKVIRSLPLLQVSGVRSRPDRILGPQRTVPFALIVRIAESQVPVTRSWMEFVLALNVVPWRVRPKPAE